MNKEKLLALLLPELSGSVKITLNDQQLLALVQELLQEKASYIKSIASKDGYIQLELNIPLVNKLDLEIVSIEINSTKLIVSLRILNIMPFLLKPVIGLLGKLGLKGKMNGDVMVVDFNDKLQGLIEGLPELAKERFDHLNIEVLPQNGKLQVSIYTAS